MNQQWMLLSRWIVASFLFFVLFSCKKSDDTADSPVIEKEFSITGFSRVYSTSNFHITITKGNEYRVRAKGVAKYVNDLDLRLISGHTLDIQYARYSNPQPMDIFITMPHLYQFNIAAGGKGEVNGFANDNNTLRLVLSAASESVVNGTPVNVGFDIYGGSKLELKGVTADLYGTLSAGSRLNAFDLISTDVDVDASGGSVANVRVENVFFGSASGGSKIYYKGDPYFKELETNSGGEIIQQ